MEDYISQYVEPAINWMEDYPGLLVASALIGLAIISWITNWVVKRILVRGIMRALDKTPARRDRNYLERTVIARIANVAPALVFTFGIVMVPHASDTVVTVVRNVAGAFIVLSIALAMGGALTLANTIYERRPRSAEKPIKGYVQVIKIAIYVVAAILIVAALIDRSPVILLSGLGAMAAVLMLVFQDTLLSLVASMQITSNDIVRVGDWVEMPDANADGDVIDIALHTVKVQNWDKTITTIPTRRFITNGFKNWRGMQESGGRRMMRNLMLDQQTIHFLSDEEVKNLRRFRLLNDYLDEKQKEIDDWNKELEEQGKDPVNSRRVTNIGTFRAYVQKYLENHPNIHKELMIMVRQLSPTPDGLPLQVYGFTNTTSWAEYEGIQSDIFDHLYAIVPEFGLRVYQHPTGRDLKEINLGGPKERTDS